ncbi:hypothetical protein MSG28_008915 [Choristoneura fumiferana]|uniref:Uncharacterized protein n=1 Tax=Choristoneura fumiferana TaxID=7141 RepID=A0ACC0J8Q3_CHOFU|nr:hypothetical protein MSG28_008915 [Choristoneura fumiferana]
MASDMRMKPAMALKLNRKGRTPTSVMMARPTPSRTQLMRTDTTLRETIFPPLLLFQRRFSRACSLQLVMVPTMKAKGAVTMPTRPATNL